MDNQEYPRENLEDSLAALGITMEIRTFKPHHKPMQLQPHYIIAVNLMAGKYNSLEKSGSLADDCGTGQVRPFCALEI